MKPHIHCRSSVKKFWWIEEDYMAIHDFIDCSKVAFGDNRHRALTHNNWFVFIVERVFGHTIINSRGNEVSVREIAEQHILEDFKMKFIPNVQDYLNLMMFPSWLNNWEGPDVPQSCGYMKLKGKQQFILPNTKKTCQWTNDNDNSRSKSVSCRQN